MLGLKGFSYRITILSMHYQKKAQNRPHPPMTNTALCTFKNENLFKNLSSLIFQLVPFLYRPLVLSLAWKIVGSYTRVFAVLSPLR